MEYSKEIYQSYCPIIAEDLLKGINDWSNTQQIVRLTLKALSDVVRQQGEGIQQLNQEIAETRRWVLQQLQAKASVEDVGKSLKEMYHSFSNNGNSDFKQIESSLRHIKDCLEDKVSCQDFQEELSRKANKQSVANALHRKANRSEVEQQLEGKANLIELQGILDAIDRKIEKSDFEEKIMMVVSKKNNEIVKMLEELKNESIRESFYDSQLDLLQNEIKDIKAQLSDGTIQKNNWRGQNEIRVLQDNFIKQMNEKVSIYQLEGEIQKQLNQTQRANIREPSESIALIFQQIDTIKNQLQLKASLIDIQPVLIQKLNSQDFEYFVNEQTSINQTLCSENCIARWLWKKNKTNRNRVIWDVVSINTCPENFQLDSYCINTVAPGLYYISVGFFGVNVQRICVYLDNYILIEKDNKQKPRDRSEMRAFSINEFIALPGNSKLSVEVCSNDNIEGFIGLRKI